MNVDVGTTVTITGVQTASGPRSPTAASGWTSSTNAESNNSVYATASAAASNGTSANLSVSGFGFSIPSTASVNGIAVSVYRYATPLSEVETITQSGTAPTGATFQISVCGTHTASIAYNATAATVASAINTACGAGTIACVGGALHTAAVTCTFSSTADQTQMSTYTVSSGWSSNKPTYATLQNGGGVTLKDSTVYLLKGGAVPGGEQNKASASAWPTSKGTATYGNTADLWGATWTPADINASNFGVQLAATNTSAYSSETGNVDYVSVTVTYTPLPTAGVGSAATPVANLNVGETCQLNSNTPHSPCSPADYTWATNTTTTAAADNPALIMPTVDFSYWYANAKPGPKHFCTNPNPGITSSFFDNNTKLDGSITVNGEMAGNTRSDPHGYSSWTYDSTTPSIDYDCQVWSGGGTKGTLLGRISWNHTTHVMNIKGTVFIDGAFRFDNDAQVVHYFGRGDLMSSREDEIDSLVCAGWSSGGTNTTDLAHSCIQNMASWDPTHNMMVLMADTAAIVEQERPVRQRRRVPRHHRRLRGVRPGRDDLQRRQPPDHELLLRQRPVGLPGDPLLEQHVRHPPGIPGQRPRHLQPHLRPERRERRPELLHVPVHGRPHRRPDVRRHGERVQLPDRSGPTRPLSRQARPDVAVTLGR